MIQELIRGKGEKTEDGGEDCGDFVMFAVLRDKSNKSLYADFL